MQILAAQFGFDSREIRTLRGMAINDVKRTRGRIDLEEIADFQRGIATQSYPPIPEEADDYGYE